MLAMLINSTLTSTYLDCFEQTTAATVVTF